MKNGSTSGSIIAIAGTGALGRSLARAFVAAGMPLKVMLSRDPASVLLPDELATVRVITSGPAIFHPEAGLLLFLAVPDGAIGTTAERLSQSGRWEGTTVVHCSGAMPASLLEPLKSKGASVASFHPVQTFAPGSGPESFRDIIISLQGDEMAVKRLEPVVTKLGARALRVDEAGKLKLHLAAVFISNYLAGLMEAAGEIAGDLAGSGITIEDVLGPIHVSAARNIVRSDRRQALTGPILRGDCETVRRHLDALNGNTELIQLYARLGLYTLRVAKAVRTEPGHKAIRNLLESIIGK
ncbi:MAG: Rossmann-like and DUF2520 domain-containing protein [Cyclonatronaceae bacterium]